QQAHRRAESRYPRPDPRRSSSQPARRLAPGDSGDPRRPHAAARQPFAKERNVIPQRQILWNVPPGAMELLYALTALSTAWIAFWFARRSRLWLRGSPTADQLGWRAGLSRLCSYLLSHRKFENDRYARWMHLLIFWGFVALLTATALVAIQH